MSVPHVHESQLNELDLPGRHLAWAVGEGGLDSRLCSACVIRVAPGEKVRPAHSHPQGEEVIYIIHGSGRVMVGGEVTEVHAGSVVLFPQGVVHMLQNTGPDEMKVVCFFAPATSLANYRMHEGADFPAACSPGEEGGVKR